MAKNGISNLSGRDFESRVNHKAPKLIRLSMQGFPCQWTRFSGAKMAKVIISYKEKSIKNNG